MTTFKTGAGHLLFLPFAINRWEAKAIYRYSTSDGYQLPRWLRLWFKVRAAIAKRTTNKV